MTLSSTPRSRRESRLVNTERALTIETAIVADPKHVSCDVGGEVVMLSLETGEYYGMNPVAARIWSLVQAETTVAAVRDELLREYDDVTPEQCTEDLLEVLTRMREWGLINPVAPR